ncbi:MAG: hypothetical protein PHY05_01130 [Methanothrix sp.]|nr:hypothetical protein [Methanothrix sp.]
MLFGQFANFLPCTFFTHFTLAKVCKEQQAASDEQAFFADQIYYEPSNPLQQFQAAVREYLSISCQVSWTQMMVVSPRYSDKYNEEEMRWRSTRWASLLIL